MDRMMSVTVLDRDGVEVVISLAESSGDGTYDMLDTWMEFKRGGIAVSVPFFQFRAGVNALYEAL